MSWDPFYDDPHHDMREEVRRQRDEDGVEDDRREQLDELRRDAQRDQDEDERDERLR